MRSWRTFIATRIPEQHSPSELLRLTCLESLLPIHIEMAWLQAPTVNPS